MRCTLFVLALSFCFIAVTSRSPAEPGFFVITIVLEVIAFAGARTRTKPGFVSSPPVPPPLSSLSSSYLSSISTSSRTNYEVFLSFRGPDTRKGFADCLYTRLIDAGINVFRDNIDLDPGEKIHDALLEYIKQSKISMPIISEDYASSRSCLMELAQMMECEKANNQLIVPIFYDVHPTDLKYQRGSVGESLRKHENRGVDHRDIAKWKQALREIAERNGYDLPNTYKGYQGELIRTVVSRILLLLKKNDLVVTGNLVGIESHVPEVMKKLGVIYVNEEAMGVCGKDVCVLGICGMPGIGKTTVAKVVYNRSHHLFQGCSFLSNIRENVELNKLMGLQEQLIADLQKQEHKRLSTPDEGSKVIAHSFSNMNVLILLDDVHDFDQIKPLVGNLNWFGPGSRILMTVGRKDVLDKYGDGVADKYEVALMRPDHSLQLFRKLAFPGHPPEEEEDEYDSLSSNIIDAIDGLPLTIKATASYLHEIGWDIKIWRETLHRIRRKPDGKVKKTFVVSYNSLNDETREIFLDIACFLDGMDNRIPLYMWHAAGYSPLGGIKILCDMCLIKVGENNELWIHNQLKKYGREIVRREDLKRPRKRSRLWDHTDALSTLTWKESATNVEALCLKFDEGRSECFRSEAFGHLRNVRFLRLDQATIEGSSQNVLSNLRWLQWQGCRQISELLIFHLENLVILDLACSLVMGDSQEWGQILQKAKELKVLILSGCPHLHASPDFHSAMPLERLVLERCPQLSQISESIRNLKNLVSLNLKFCRLVTDLPEELCSMTALEELLIDGTSISIIHFRQASMQRLKTLSACQCENLVLITDSIGHLKSLLYLGLDGAAIDRLPDSIGSLTKLQKLLLGNCRKLAELPDSIGNLLSLEVMDLSSTMITTLPENFSELQLRKLVLHYPNLLDLRQLPSSLSVLCLQHCMIQDSRFSTVRGLSELVLQHCRLAEIVSLGDLRRLELLKISDCNVQKLDGLENLPRFRRLTLLDCPSLTGLPDRTNRTFEIDGYNFPGEQ